MVVTIQGVPERLKNIADLQAQFKSPCTAFIDYEHKGCFFSFSEMLKIPVKDFRLHLQDDVILADNLEAYFPYIQNIMRTRPIEVLSLYVPQSKEALKYIEKGYTIMPIPSLWIQAVVWSKRVNNLMLKHFQLGLRNKHDDCFMIEVLKKEKIKAYMHLPSLAQHDVDNLPSLLGHFAKVNRKSTCFDINYVNKKLGL